MASSASAGASLEAAAGAAAGTEIGAALMADWLLAPHAVVKSANANNAAMFLTLFMVFFPVCVVHVMLFFISRCRANKSTSHPKTQKANTN